MPTPVGHSLAGLAVHLAGPQRLGPRRGLAAIGLIGLANLPDIDFLPGYLIGEPRAFHWGATHSLAAAVIAGALAGLVARALTGRFFPFFLLGTAAYGSHVVLDLLIGPTTGDRGIELFWPLSRERHMAPWSVFHMFPRAIEQLGPIRTLFTREVIPVILRELMIMGPVCAVAWLTGLLTRPGGTSGALAEPGRASGGGTPARREGS